MERQTPLFPDLDEVLPAGVSLRRDVFDAGTQVRHLDLVAGVLAQTPPFRPRMRGGTPFTYDIGNCGPLGWVSDEAGYRYQAAHPVTGRPWPTIPDALFEAARSAAADAGYDGFAPDACLINLYGAGARLGLHQDKDEADFRWPIVSFSFGADAVFALGGATRRDAIRRLTIHAGDVLVLGGPSRLRFHGIDRLRPASADSMPPVPPGGRINLTFRRAR